MKTLGKYLPNLKVENKPLKMEDLSLHYRSLYSISKMTLDGSPFLAVALKDKVPSIGPREFKKHISVFEEKYKLPVIWCLQDLAYEKIQRLMEYGFNFIIDEKVVYLPTLNSIIKIEKPLHKSKASKVSPLGINVLIEQLLEKSIEGLSKINIAKKFGVSQMTIARALETLISNNLCSEEKNGIEKVIRFSSEKELWNYIKENIESPVIEVIYTKDHIIGLPLSGISALANNSMLADDHVPTMAISKKRLTEFKNIEVTSKDEAHLSLEIWNREPIFKKEQTINVIDAYLILKNNQDERVQIALEDWLNRYKFN
ncbi:MAG: hypothetical protein PHY93_03120 [Bacteriovorax sp.]|nr:hypothetical protein [Bacteriovorax sp.]